MQHHKTHSTALIIMAHGSRQAAANEEFQALVNTIDQHNLAYTSIHHCFLELAQPDLHSAVNAALKNNVSAIDVYPLFFNQGNHVQRDIPKQIAEIKQQYPKLTIQALDYFGCHPSLGQIIAEHIVHQKSE